MNRIIRGGARKGAVHIPSSKSFAHRHLLCAALSQAESTVFCRGISKDISATISCLNALGASIREEAENALRISPVRFVPRETMQCRCGESGSTLRFLLPVASALGADVAFHTEGRLAQRPHGELTKCLEAHGAHIGCDGQVLTCSGQLAPGAYGIAGNISSQFISGLLFALPLLGGDSTLTVVGEIESSAYIAMTEQVLRDSGIRFEKAGNVYHIFGNQKYLAPESATVEGDWSSAAFFLCMGALSRENVAVSGLNPASRQGDRALLDILRLFGANVRVSGETVSVQRGELTGQTIDASEIPDLVPAIAALACGASGTTRIVRAERLRYKESDRLRSAAQMLSALGASVTETEDGLLIHGAKRLSGGTVEPANDHRIAMAAAVAANLCESDVLLRDAQCVEKSYPAFWRDFDGLEVI